MITYMDKPLCDKEFNLTKLIIQKEIKDPNQKAIILTLADTLTKARIDIVKAIYIKERLSVFEIDTIIKQIDAYLA